MKETIELKDKKTVSLKTLAEIYDIPLWTLRKRASARTLPGLILMGSRIYVNLAVFDKWFMTHELKYESENHVLDGTRGTPKLKFFNNLIGGFYQ